MYSMLHPRQMFLMWTKLYFILQLIKWGHMHYIMSYCLLPNLKFIRLCLLWSLFIELPELHRFPPVYHLPGHSYSCQCPLCASQLCQLRCMWLNCNPSHMPELHITLLIVQSQVLWCLSCVLLCHQEPYVFGQRVSKMYLELYQLYHKWHMWCMYPWLHIFERLRLCQWGCV